MYDTSFVRQLYGGNDALRISYKIPQVFSKRPSHCHKDETTRYPALLSQISDRNFEIWRLLRPVRPLWEKLGHKDSLQRAVQIIVSKPIFQKDQQ